MDTAPTVPPAAPSSPAARPLRRWWGRLGEARLRRCTDGAVALEFALVLPVFLLMILAVLETGLMMITSVILQGAAIDTARLLRTGQVQSAADALSAYETALCDEVTPFLSCEVVYYDVRNFSDYGGVALPDPTFDDDGALSNGEFEPGGAESVMTVRVIHRWHFFTPAISALMADSGGERTLMSTVIIKAEPWE